MAGASGGCLSHSVPNTLGLSFLEYCSDLVRKWDWGFHFVAYVYMLYVCVYACSHVYIYSNMQVEEFTVFFNHFQPY